MSNETIERSILQQYSTLYPENEVCTVNWGQWCSAAWNLDYPDGGYHRAIGNRVSVLGLIKLLDPSSPNADIKNLVQQLMSIVTDYDLASYGAGRVGWKTYSGGYKQVGGLFFIASVIGFVISIGSSMLWPYLTAGQRTQVRSVVRNLADRLVAAHTVSYYNSVNFVGDTAGEEASSDGAFLSVASQFDPGYVNAGAWLTAAHTAFQWAIAPGNGMNSVAHPYLSNNHNIDPYPIYAQSVLADLARALIPWSATKTLTLGVFNSFVSTSAFNNVYNALAAWTNTSDWSHTGTVTSLVDASTINIASKCYMGRCGMSEWGFGADFQNGMYSLASWLAEQGASPSSYATDYASLLGWQSGRPALGFLPTRHANNGAGPVQTTLSGWNWTPCVTTYHGVTRISVDYFVQIPTDLASQSNSHTYLNSFSAMHHIAAYLIQRATPLWTTLPDFGT